MMNLFFFFCTLTDDVWRAAFAFVIDAADVFAEDAHEGELDAADEEDKGDEGRISRYVFTVEQGAQDNEDEVDELLLLIRDSFIPAFFVLEKTLMNKVNEVGENW